MLSKKNRKTYNKIFNNVFTIVSKKNKKLYNKNPVKCFKLNTDKVIIIAAINTRFIKAIFSAQHNKRQ